MEASPAVTVPSAPPDELVVGVVAADAGLRARVGETATGAGADVRVSAAGVDELLAEHFAEELTTVVLSCPLAETAELVERLGQALPNASVVVVPAADGQRPTLRRMLDLGADAVVLEGQVEHNLPSALAAVQSDQVVLPRELVRRQQTPLSFREKQILALVVMGYTNAGIATKLFLAESTVKSHLSSAFAKLGVRSRHEAAALLADPQQMGLGVLTIARD